MTSPILACAFVLLNQGSAPAPQWVVARSTPLSAAEKLKLANAEEDASLAKVATSLGLATARLDDGAWLLFDPVYVFERKAPPKVLTELLGKATGDTPIMVSDLDPESKAYVKGVLRNIGPYYTNVSEETLEKVPIHVGVSVEAWIDYPSKSDVAFLNRSVPLEMAQKLSSNAPKVPLPEVKGETRYMIPPEKTAFIQLQVTYSHGGQGAKSALERGREVLEKMARLREEYRRTMDSMLAPRMDALLRALGDGQFVSERDYRTLDDLPGEVRSKLQAELDQNWKVMGWESPEAAARDYSKAKLRGTRRSLVLQIGLMNSATYVYPIGDVGRRG